MKNWSVSSNLQFSEGLGKAKLSIPFFSGLGGSLKNKTLVHARACKGFIKLKAQESAVLCSKNWFSEAFFRISNPC